MPEGVGGDANGVSALRRSREFCRGILGSERGGRRMPAMASDDAARNDLRQSRLTRFQVTVSFLSGEAKHYTTPGRFRS